MNDLSKKEKLVMITIWKMKDNPFGLNIRRELSKLTRRTWSIGALYFSLDRLEKKGILKSYVIQSCQEQRSHGKRLYDFTSLGFEQVKKIMGFEEYTIKK